jgi:hypothetical protein
MGFHQFHPGGYQQFAFKRLGEALLKALEVIEVLLKEAFLN